MRFALIGIVMLLSSSSFALNLLKGVSAVQEDNQMVTIYEFLEPLDPTMIQTSVNGKMLEVSFPNVEMLSDKNSVSVGQFGLISIDSTLEGGNVVKSKINFEQPIPERSGYDPVKVVADQNRIKVFTDKASDKIGVSTTAKANGALDLKTKTEPKETLASLKESEIPVLTKGKDQKKASVENPIVKLLLSLVLIAGLSFGVVLVSKRYLKNFRKTADNNKIRVLTTHHLGPKKQLLIVRVAGESLLLGVTDHNINMIKSLSLIDDEFPTSVPESFSESMVAADQKSTEKNNDSIIKPKKAIKEKVDSEIDEFVISGIQDKVSIKLKGMRDL